MTIGHVEDEDVDDASSTMTSEKSGDDAAGSDERPPADDATNERRGWMRRLTSHWPLIVVGLLLVAAAAATAVLYWGQYREDQQTNDAAANSAIRAASDGTVALLSYVPEKLEADLAAAKARLTGDFLTYYGKFTDQILAPAAKTKAVNTRATVKRAVIAELHKDTARVLVFLDQTTTSKDAPEPVQTASSVMVSLTKAKGAWLISAFDPI